jgi:hypothetical protein
MASWYRPDGMMCIQHYKNVALYLYSGDESQAEHPAILTEVSQFLSVLKKHRDVDLK